MEAMTLIDVRDWHRFVQQSEAANGRERSAHAHQQLADAIDAHLAKTKQIAASEREAFEKWLDEQGFTTKPERRAGGKYVNGQIQGNWLAWQAARAHLAQPAQAVDYTGRSAKDYAIEHAGYMARGATGLIDAINDLELARQQFDEGDGSEDATNAAEQSLGDAMSALRNIIYEFEKRRDRALSGEKAGRVGEWRDAFEDCYMRANEVGILHRDDDGEYTSAFTKVAWATWNERACLSPIDWWHASRDDDARTWTVHSPSGDSCEVHERAAGPQAEILRQLAQSLPASPTPDKEGEG